MEGIDLFGILNDFLSLFGIGSFLGGDMSRDCFFLVRFPGVMLALVSTVNPELVSPGILELTDRPVQSLFTTINSGANVSD